MEMIALLVVFLAAFTTPTIQTPIDVTTGHLIDCYMGMDTQAYQCIPKDGHDYLHCNIEATYKCNCAEGLVCRRDTYDKYGTQQCAFQCVIEDPVSYGMKNIKEWDENMERVYK